MRGRRRLELEVERFESVEAAEGVTLLRIAGRWRSRTLERVPEPAMVVNGAGGETVLELLPDPGALPAFADADPPPWRAGFALPGRPGAGATYALRLADGSTYGLPAPARGSLHAPRGGASPELEEQLAVAERESARTEEALEVARRRLGEEIARRKEAEERLELAGGSALDAIGAEAARRAEQVRELEARIMTLRAALDDD